MNSKNFTKTEVIYLFLIFALALALRIWGLDWGLPHLYQSEEYKVIKYALRMGGGDLNPHYFEYPSLYLYFILGIYGIYFAIGFIAGIFQNATEFAYLYINNPSSFHLIGRALEIFFNLSFIALSVYIARHVFSKRTAIFTALSLAVLPELVSLSHMTKGDSAGILLALLFWWFCYRIYETGEKKFYIYSGIFLGLMFSTKYYLLPMGIVLPLAHILSQQRKSFATLCLAFALAPIAFLVGTPFALSSEFLDQFKSVLLNIRPTDAFWQNALPDPFFVRMKICFIRLISMNQSAPQFLISSIGLGIISWIGMWTFMYLRFKKSLFFALSIAAFYFVVAKSYHPAAGYLRPIFPLFIMTGAYFIDRLLNEEYHSWVFINLKTPILFFAIFSIFSSAIDSALTSFKYSLPDTRTIAKNWIDQNIPKKSKVLMDLIPDSPPLEMTRTQVEKFSTIANQSNHYKKEYFQLKLDSFNDNQSTYEIYWIKKSGSEIGSLPEQVEQVQKTQDLYDVQGTLQDFDRLKQLGIQYVITNYTAVRDAQNKIPRLKNFYALLEQNYTPIYVISPQTASHPGPEIKVYRLQ